MLHQFEDEAVTLDAPFTNYPSAAFSITGQTPAENQVPADLGLRADYSNALSLSPSFTADLGDDCGSQPLTGGLVWSF